MRWVPVEVGIREGGRVEVRAPPLSGRVVTLGQELCDDGASVEVFGPAPQGSAAR